MTINELIAEAKKGKRNAQNLLIDLLWQQVYNYVLFRIKDEEEVEDITIETFTKVFSKLKLYNEEFDFKTWVISIAHNTMLDHLRKSTYFNPNFKEDFNELVLLDNEISPEDYLILKQSNEEVLSAINLLPAIYKKIIELRFIEDKTYKEISEELNLSMANVKVRVLRAKQLLSEILNK